MGELLRFLTIMASLLDRIVGLIAGFQTREAELRQQLADALADDAADDEAVAAALAAADEAGQRAAAAEALVSDLQATATDATTQLEAIERFIGGLEQPAPEPQPQSAPAVEPEPAAE